MRIDKSRARTLGPGRHQEWGGFRVRGCDGHRLAQTHRLTNARTNVERARNESKFSRRSIETRRRRIPLTTDHRRAGAQAFKRAASSAHTNLESAGFIDKQPDTGGGVLTPCTEQSLSAAAGGGGPDHGLQREAGESRQGLRRRHDDIGTVIHRLHAARILAIDIGGHGCFFETGSAGTVVAAHETHDVGGVG